MLHSKLINGPIFLGTQDILLENVPVNFAELGQDGPSKYLLMTAPTIAMIGIPIRTKKLPYISIEACL